jgi:putative Ca2+/H+ antiporter (TMEM165/GDT1 family)
MLQAILSSFSLVAVSEMGDKTQLLAFSLAARYKKPWLVMAGIFVATVLNHALASAVGEWAAVQITPRFLAGALGVTFIIFGIWTLKPDTLEEKKRHPMLGPFLTTAVLFFFAEMGDKTQFATVALGARFHSVVAVTLGTTFGMMVADGLAVFLGEELAEHVSMKKMRWVAAGLFIAFGGVSLLSLLS